MVAEPEQGTEGLVPGMLRGSVKLLARSGAQGEGKLGKLASPSRLTFHHG